MARLLRGAARAPNIDTVVGGGSLGEELQTLEHSLCALSLKRCSTAALHVRRERGSGGVMGLPRRRRTRVCRESFI